MEGANPALCNKLHYKHNELPSMLKVC